MRANVVCGAQCENAPLGAHHRHVVIDCAHGATVVIAGRSYVNFVSASYLGFSDMHTVDAELKVSASQLPLSLALPRALATDHATLELERRLAMLLSQPAALVAPSTLHLLNDVVRVLAGSRGAVLLDARCYSLSVAAAATAKGTGASVHSFEHYDPDALGRALNSVHGRRCVVLCDGVAMPGQQAPLRGLLEHCERAGAYLVVDDTQGFGLFGRHPRLPEAPYGLGGAGTARQQAVSSPRLVVIASMAKAFSIPLAFVAGSAAAVGRIYREADFVSNSSPPDLLTVRTALRILEVNERAGDQRRHELASAVRDLAAETGTSGFSGFPVQSWYFDDAHRAVKSHQALMDAGIWAVLVRKPVEQPSKAAIRFLVTAAHEGPVMARALDAIKRVRRKVQQW